MFSTFICQLNLGMFPSAYSEPYLIFLLVVVTLDQEGSIIFFFVLGNKRWHAAKLQGPLVYINICLCTSRANAATFGTADLGARQKTNLTACLYIFFSVDEILPC